MYSEQLVQVFSSKQVNKEYTLSFYRPGELSSLQFLLLNESFSNIRPFIANKPFTVSEIYCITKSYISPWAVNIHINNIVNQTFNITENAFMINPNINIAINDSLSISALPTTVAEDILVTIKLEYE